MPAARMTRRGFLDTTFGAAATAMLPWPGAVGAAGRPMLEQLSVARLEDGLYLLSCSDWNVLALCGPQGMLLVDGGAALYTRELLAALGALPNGGPVKVLFNTHWHWNHTGSNEALAAQHAQIIAHRNTKLWLGTPITVEWQHHTYPPRPAAALPTTTFVNGTPDMQFSGQPVRYGHLPAAHTDGDLYVHLPQPNVIVAGGVVAAGRYPTIDYSTGGWIGGMAEATRSLIGLANEHTRIIPGCGAILSRADLQAQLKMLETIRDRIGNAIRKALDFEELLATAPTREFNDRFGDPTQFLQLAWASTRGHERDLGWIF